MSTKTHRTSTQAGSPCARAWSQDWIATVNTKESELNHRICGARLPDGSPCTNTSGHPSGRCRFHGGFDLTGAPRGNRNAAIHGLYSRRLRTCTPNCPYWQSCPCAGPNTSHDLSDLSDPSDPSDSTSHSPQNPQSEIRNPQWDNPHSSPLCPYQLTEYNTVVTDALAIVESQPHPNPMGTHAAHNVAILQVLINTAATHLANTGVAQADVARASSPCSPEAGNANPNATLAFLRLMREFRAALRLLYIPANTPLFRQKHTHTPPSPEGVVRHAERAQHDTEIDPDSLAAAQLEDQPEHLHAKAYLRQAIQAASQGRDVDTAEAFDNVIQLDEHLAESERDHVLASYRPAKHSVSEELAAAILGNLHLPPLPDNPDNGESTAHQNEIKMLQESNKLLQHYLDSFRAGKIPPEAFPIGSPIRAYAESIYAAPSTATETAEETCPGESP